jgi:acetyltransferase-like isoleucine patch superfamily enzyme
LAPNATTGGNVSVGEFSAISIGATIKHGISIGKHTIIGAGALVLNNFGDNCIVYGTPAKEIRKRTAGERYL